MTCRTDARRASRSSPDGTSNGTRASVSVRFARTMRCAIVEAGTRKARAISSVVRLARSRRVRAARGSGARTGWQETKIRRSRSSSTSSALGMFRSAMALSCWAAISRPSSSCLRSSRSLRRRRSIARCFAVAMSQAPGLSGTPDSGHCSSAATSASCARSSARPTSRTTRVRPAMSRGASILHTASMAPCVSVPVTDDLLAYFLDQAVAVADDLAETLGPLDRLFARLDLDQREPARQLLRLGERPVGHGQLPPGVADPRGGWCQPAGREQDPRSPRLFCELPDLLDHLRGRRSARLRVVARGVKQELHFASPSIWPVFRLYLHVEQGGS